MYDCITITSHGGGGGRGVMSLWRHDAHASENLVYQNLLALARTDSFPVRLWVQGGLGLCRLRVLRSGAGPSRLRRLRRKCLDGK